MRPKAVQSPHNADGGIRVEQLQLLKDLIGHPVYEKFSGEVYEHIVEGFMVDSTGVYIILQDGGMLNAKRAWLSGLKGKLYPVSLLFL